MFLHYLYNIILVIVFIKTIILCRKFGLSAQNNFLVLMLITVLVEGFSFVLDKIDPNITIATQYNLYLLFVILYFHYFYSSIVKIHILKNISIVVLLITVSYILGFTRLLGYNFDTKISVAAFVFLIFHTLMWFFHKLTFVNHLSIFNDTHFWVSCGLLFWSTFGIFRCIPMYYFYENDRSFSDFLKENFLAVNIIMYLLFYISMIKYERNYNREITARN